jgi:hypothetical protein
MVESYLKEVHKILLNDGSYSSKNGSPAKPALGEERMELN